MQAIPPAPQFQFAPISVGIVFLLAVGLAILALVAVITVLVASGKSVIPWPRIKALAGMLALIVPALVLVGYVSVRSDSHHFERVVMESQATRVHGRVTVQAEAPIQTPRSESGIQPISETKSASAKGVGAPAENQDAGPAEFATTPSAEAHPSDINQSQYLPAESLTGVLKVRETGAKPPFWAGTEPIVSGGGVLVPMSSQRFATLAEAEQQVTEKAVAYVRQFYRDEYPLSGDWTVPVEIIEKNAVNTIVGEEFDKDFGNGVVAKMYQVHLRLDVNPALRNALNASWHDQIVSHRLMLLGAALGFVTLILGTSSGYFWLDDATGGQYRHRLKLAAAALIAAGGLIVVVA